MNKEIELMNVKILDLRNGIELVRGAGLTESEIVLLHWLGVQQLHLMSLETIYEAQRYEPERI